MLLFDLQDYIPLLPKCPTTSDWGDMYITATETRNAFMKALEQWYLASTTCLPKDGPCTRQIVQQWNTVLEFYSGEYNTAFTNFWESLSKETSSFNDDTCNRYRKMMVDWRCHIKKLMRLVDNDFSSEQLSLG
jgi:hypothetical protein